MSASSNQPICDQKLIAAYVDGELGEGVRESLERHFEQCTNCRDELRAHRIFICELDSVLTHPAVLDVPRDFSRVVAARAKSDMSGVRSAAENKKALVFCLLLGIASVALMSSTSRLAVIGTVRQVVGMVVGTLGVLATAFYDVAASVAVIFRVLSRKLIVESNSLGVLLVLFALAIVLLSRMISRYHRTGATE